ncbi:uncharacterized protein LOC112433312 [Maylandia zebra]|uniref:uncharacterized protein LOC112433312 n=1 Tax=Maylandia zebra TaxID=106582 RepID=UPI00403C9243
MMHFFSPCTGPFMTGTGTTERQRQTSKLHRAHAAPGRINDVPDPQLKPSHPLPPRRLLPGPSRTTHQPLCTLKPCVDQEISRTGTTERQRQTSKLHRAHAAPGRINDVPDPQLKPSHPLPPRRLLPGPSRTTHQPLCTLKPCVDQEISRTGTTERQRQTSKLHRAHAAPGRINDVPDPQLKPSHPLPPRRLLLGPSRTTHQPLVHIPILHNGPSITGHLLTLKSILISLQEDNKQKKESGTKEAKKRKSAPPPDTTSTKKSKCTSSAEGDDKEVFLLPVRGRERYEMLKKINDGLELLDKDSKSKSKVSVKHEVPVPSSGKRLLQRGERSDSD